MTKVERVQRLKDRLRGRIEIRNAAGTAVMDIQDALEKYSDLNPRARHFAHAYATCTVHRSYQQWANLYGVSYGTIQSYMLNPRVIALIEEIQFDVLKFTVAKVQDLFLQGLDQYGRIFAMPEMADGPILEAKRKAAADVLEITRSIEQKGQGREDAAAPSVAININTLKQDTNTEVKVEAVEEERESLRGKLKALQDDLSLIELAEEYARKEEGE